jgi:hypothetical protein
MKCLVTKWNEKEGNTLTENKMIRINDNKPEFGSLMLISPVTELSPGGFLNKRNKVGFIVGRVEDLEATLTEFKLTDGTDFSVAVAPHRIVTLEKLESQVQENEYYREKINPSTGEILKKDGDTIMWRTEVVAEGSDIVEVKITHDRQPVADAAVAEFVEAKEAKK